MAAPVQLRCIAAYREGDVRFAVGDVVHTNEADAARIMRGAPSAWEVAVGSVRVGGPGEYIDYESAPADPAPGAPAAADAELARLTTAQLIVLAGERGVDVKGLSRKADLVAALVAAAAAGEEPAVAAVDLDDLDDAALRAYAADHNVPLAGDEGRLAIIAAIERVLGDATGDAAEDD